VANNPFFPRKGEEPESASVPARAPLPPPLAPLGSAPGRPAAQAGPNSGQAPPGALPARGVFQTHARTASDAHSLPGLPGALAAPLRPGFAPAAQPAPAAPQQPTFDPRNPRATLQVEAVAPTSPGGLTEAQYHQLVHTVQATSGEERTIQLTPEQEERLGAATSPRHKVEAWLNVMVNTGASDLILRAGGRPSIRVAGRIGFMPGRVPAAGPLLEVLEWIIGPERLSAWKETGSADVALHLDGLGRFRLNAYKQMGEPALVLRRVSTQAPVLENLELPTADLQRLALRRRGLLLVTGIAGSGKSTTLAALIEYMNLSAERHIITLEDPIEVLFTERRCVISQREIGIDCPGFHDGLRHALRQSPDVILIGEMRDRDTVSAALDAAETGHYVLSTMHTVNAAQTLDRILGFYPPEQHSQVRTRLADNLAGVLSQRLIPRAAAPGMVPAVELLIQTPRIRELLEKGETGEIMRCIETGTTPGMISFNQSLKRLVQERLIDLKDALAASDRPEELVLALRGITSGARSTPAGGGRPPTGNA
jgi:twitching motility protein PilT